jgi:hypothetical protein
MNHVFELDPATEERSMALFIGMAGVNLAGALTILSHDNPIFMLEHWALGFFAVGICICVLKGLISYVLIQFALSVEFTRRWSSRLGYSSTAITFLAIALSISARSFWGCVAWIVASATGYFAFRIFCDELEKTDRELERLPDGVPAQESQTNTNG